LSGVRSTVPSGGFSEIRFIVLSGELSEITFIIPSDLVRGDYRTPIENKEQVRRSDFN
jgi:hypothetical protein